MFYLEEGLFPLPPPDGFPVVLGAFTNPDIFFPFDSFVANSF